MFLSVLQYQFCAVCLCVYGALVSVAALSTALQTQTMQRYMSAALSYFHLSLNIDHNLSNNLNFFSLNNRVLSTTPLML